MHKSIKAAAIAIAAVGSLAAMKSYHPPEKPAEPSAYLLADLSDKILYLYEGDSVAYMYDISDGKDGYPTPKGGFNVRKLTWNPSWTPPDADWAKKKRPTPPGDPKNPMKVVKIFFKEPDYYIHGTGDEEALGGAASHGCIRMSQADAFRLGRYLMDHGGAKHDDAWYAGVFNRG